MKLPSSILFLLTGLLTCAYSADEPTACQFHFFAEPIVEGTYQGMDVPPSTELTLAWKWPDVEPDAPIQTEVIELTYGHRLKGPELPVGATIKIYSGNLTGDTLAGAAPFSTFIVSLDSTEALCYMIPLARDRFRASMHDLSGAMSVRGGARLVNVSDETLAAVLDDEKSVLAPGASLMMTLDQIDAFHLKMRIAAKNDGVWRPIHAARVAAKSGDRILILVGRRRGDLGPWRVRPIYNW